MIKRNHLKKIFMLITLMFLTSCSSVIINLIGNQLIDCNYAPNPQIKPFYTKIPYRIEDDYIVIKAKINNSEEEYNFIFDTGGITMVSEKLINEMGLKNGITVVLRDVNGSDVSGLSFLTSLEIGELDITNLRINTTKSEMFYNKCTGKIDGIIGPNVLKQGTYYFNASERMLIITNQKEKLPLSKFEKPTKLKRFMGQPYIPIKGFRKEWLLFDTGYAGGNILVNQKSKILDKKDTYIKQKYYPITGISSSNVKLISYFNREVKIGNTKTQIPVIQFDKKHGKGNVGNKIIQNNDFIIDVPNKKFYLPKKFNQYENGSIPNISFMYKKGIVIVSALSLNSEIEKMGIKMNDTVVKMNNFDLKEIKSKCELDKLKDNLFDNTEILTIDIKNEKIPIIYTITKKQFYE